MCSSDKFHQWRYWSVKLQSRGLIPDEKKSVRLFRWFHGSMTPSMEFYRATNYFLCYFNIWSSLWIRFDRKHHEITYYCCFKFYGQVTPPVMNFCSIYRYDFIEWTFTKLSCQKNLLVATSLPPSVKWEEEQEGQMGVRSFVQWIFLSKCHH